MGIAAKEMKIKAGSIILFYDKLTKESPGIKTGYNQTGIFVTGNEILFCRGKKILTVKVETIRGTIVTIYEPSDRELMPNIADYFNLSRQNYRIFKLGVRALGIGNHEVFRQPIIMPLLRKYMNQDDYEHAWIEFISKLRKSDYIFTFNSKSILSRLIASIDNGSWSHCGIYLGDEEIYEMTTKGTVKKNIDAYKKMFIHIGAYRHFRMTEEKRNSIDEYSKTLTYSAYPYLKAFILGIRTYFGLVNEDDPVEIPTPNGIIYRGEYYLVSYV